MAVSFPTRSRPVICHCPRPRGRIWCYVCGGDLPTLTPKQVARGKPKKPKKPTTPPAGGGEARPVAVA